MGTFHFHFAQDHFRVLYKIAVHGDPVLIGIQVYPIRFHICNAVTLLQKEDVTGDLCPCIGSERIIWQADGS